MNLQQILKEHVLWLKDRTKGKRAYLGGADLERADLREADLRGANLDFSCRPLWCGSFGVKVDRKIAIQLIFHLCKVNCEDEEIKKIQENLKPIANQFHRIENDVEELK